MSGKRKAEYQIDKHDLGHISEGDEGGNGFEKATEEEIRARRIVRRRKKPTESSEGFSFSFTPATTEKTDQTDGFKFSPPITESTQTDQKEMTKGFSFTFEDGIANKGESSNTTKMEGFKFTVPENSPENNNVPKTFSFSFNQDVTTEKPVQNKPSFELGSNTETKPFEFSFGKLESSAKAEASGFADAFLNAFKSSETAAKEDKTESTSDYVSPFSDLKSEKSWTEGENYTPSESKEASNASVVSLEGKPLESGEEDEICIHECPVKMFNFDNYEKEWRERGVGTLKLSAIGDDARLIMRTKETRIVKLNARIFPKMPCRMQNDKSIILMLHNAVNLSESNPTQPTTEAKVSENSVEKKSTRLSQILLRMKEASDASKIFSEIEKFSTPKVETSE